MINKPGSFRRLALLGVLGLAGLTACDPYQSANNSTAKIVDVIATDAAINTPPEVKAPASNTVTFALQNTDNGACVGQDVNGNSVDPAGLHDFHASYTWSTIWIQFSNQLDGTTVQSSDPFAGFPCTAAAGLTATAPLAANSTSVCYRPNGASAVNESFSYVVWTPESTPSGSAGVLQPSKTYTLSGTVTDVGKHQVPFSVTVTTDVTPASPCSPSKLSVKPTATVVGSPIGISWADNSSDEVNYVVSRGPAAAGPFTVLATLDNDSTGYTDAAVVSGTTYCYQVIAVNALGASGPAVTSSATATTCATAP